VKHKRRSRLPKRVIQKQRDALFVENLLLKVSLEVQRVQYSVLVSSIPPVKSLGGGIVQSGLAAELKINTEGIDKILELSKSGPDAYEATIPARTEH
jgi:hypothetical protein